MLETVRCSSFFTEGRGQQRAGEGSAASAGDAGESGASATDLIHSSCIFLWNEEVERLDPFLLCLEKEAEMYRRGRTSESSDGLSAELVSDDSFEQESSHSRMARESSTKEGLEGSKTRPDSDSLTADAAEATAAAR
ncbi:hypothetical protein ACSSS7_007754 [Eimeria intestinalis]